MSSSNCCSSSSSVKKKDTTAPPATPSSGGGLTGSDAAAAAAAATAGCPVCSSLTCACGPTCQCTEEFCCSQASTVLCSIPPTPPSTSSSSSPSRSQLQPRNTNGGTKGSANASSSCCASTSSAALLSSSPPRRNSHEDMQGGGGGLTSINESTTSSHLHQQQQQTATANIAVSGMTCSMCSKSVETALRQLLLPDGDIVSLSVSLATDTVTVVWKSSSSHNNKSDNDDGDDDNDVDDMENSIRETIEAIGYGVEQIDVDVVSSSTPSRQSHPSATSHNQQQQQQAAASSSSAADLLVSGMTCSMCSRAIENALRNLTGVLSVSVSLATDTVSVTWMDAARNNNNNNDNNEDDAQTTTLDKIRQTIEDIGYDVEDVVQVLIPTTSAAAAAATPSRGQTSNVNGTEELRAVRQADQQQETVEERWQGIIRRQQAKVAQRRRAFLWSLAGTIPIVIMTMILPRLEALLPAVKHAFRFLDEINIPLWPIASWWSSSSSSSTTTINSSSILALCVGQVIKCGCAPTVVVNLQDLLLWILATPVQFITGWEFYKSSYFSLFVSGTFGMDVLVALGTTAAYGYAVAGTFHHVDGSSSSSSDTDTMSSHFFETSAVLISFVLAGKWMQALAVRRTSSALIGLMQLQSTTAVKVTPLQKQQKPNETTATGNGSGSGSNFNQEKQQQSREDFNPLVDPYEERLVPIPEVQKGDLVKVIRGASIPADGRVMFGEMAVDESMVTGESLPVLKTAGGVVLGGTVCVETSATSDGSSSGSGVGAAFIEVTGVGSDTALAKIIQLVSEAQTRVVPIQTFADQVAGIFVPTVCTISLLTYMCWYALCSSGVVPASWYQDLNEDPVTFSLLFGIACLVISCPCALGLATPTAVMVGTGVGARVGVLMKGGEALEVASKVDTVVFDKTGTLTKGTPVITDYRKMDVSQQDALGAIEDNHLLWLLGSLERTSEHPLARAVVTYAESQIDDSYLKANPFAQPTSFRPLTGRGASGTVGSKRVAVGNRSFAQTLQLQIPSNVEDCMQELEQQGKTAILVAVDDIICLVMGIADQLKPDASASIKYLQDVMKIDVWMVTGDNSRTANAIARQLGLSPDRIIAEALPAAKVHQVRRLQEEDRIVAMIGDGVNDSPALAQADVGLSLGTGAEIAAEASDMVLVKGDVADVCTALHLSRSIFSRIKWNLLFSLLYNCLGIPIAAGAFYPFVKTRLPPTLAALAMGLSSISVVLSSLSLRLYRPPTVTNNTNNNRRRRSPFINSQEGRRTTLGTSATLDNDLTIGLLSNDRLGGSEAAELAASTGDNNRTVQGHDISEIV